MKRFIILFAFCLLGSSLFAQFMGLLPGLFTADICYINTMRSYNTDNGSQTVDLNASGFALKGTNFTGTGSLGFYMNSAIGLSYAATEVYNSGTSADMGVDISGFNIMMDILAGVGYKMEMGFILLAGAGVHFDGLGLNSDSVAFLSYATGAGASVKFMYPLAEGFYLGLSAGAGYDFIEVAKIHYLDADESYKGGFSWNAGIGLGFRF